MSLPHFRASFLTTLVLSGLAASLSAQVQPVALRTAPVPAAPAKASAPAAPSAWHTWSDPEGRTVVAEFRTLEGDYVTVLTKEGNRIA